LDRTISDRPLTRWAGSLILLLTPALSALGGAAAPTGGDKIWQKGKDTPIPGVITGESVEGIKLGATMSIPIISVANIDYFDAPDAYRRGHDRMEQGLYSDAIKLFEAALRNPTKAREFWLEPACRYYIALCYVEDGSDLPAAEAKFKELLEKHPDTRFLPDALLGLGRVQFNARRFDAAIAQFKKLGDLAAARNGWEEWLSASYLWQARCYLESDRYDEAQRAVKRVLDAVGDPKHDLAIQARTILAMVLLKEDKPDKAVDLLRELIKAIAPRVAEEVDRGGSDVRMQRTEAQCHNALGQAYVKLYGKTKKEEDLRSALLAYLWTVVLYSRSQFAGEHAEALYNAAQCFEKLKQKNRATELLNELTQKYPDSPFTRLLTPGKAAIPRKETEK